MENINNVIKKWLNELSSFEFANYEQLPDIDLYMDQVVQILDRELKIFATSSMDKQITSSMINNYVKGKVISAPVSKKYNREHLALIEEVCTLKQVLSIAEVKQILESTYKGNNREAFNNFKTRMKFLNNLAIDDANTQIEGIETNDLERLNEVALNLSLTANAYISIAKRILFLTKHYEEILNLEEDNKDKNKK